MVIISCFVVYFLTLVLFSLLSHPIYYCGLLVLNSFTSSLICYYLFGFSWYSLLFCLVYVGGVYILFIFISAFNPNNSFVLNVWFSYNNIFIIMFVLVLFSLGIAYCIIPYEFSSNLCSNSEGNFYICMCLTLIFGFVILSLIVSMKFNHYR